MIGGQRTASSLRQSQQTSLYISILMIARFSQLGVGHGDGLKLPSWSVRSIAQVPRRVALDIIFPEPQNPEILFEGVLSFLSTPNVYAEFAMLGMSKSFLVVSERAPLPDDASWTRRKLLRRLHQLADRVTVNTRHQHETLEAECPWLRGKVMTIRNGLDLDTFRPPPPKPPDAERDQTIRRIAVGTMQPRKNMVTLIRALAEYRQKYSDLPFQVNWAGKKSLAEQQIRTFQQAEELISELNLRDHWHWLGEHAEVAPLLQQHDALIHPGLREGLSNAICEALACGRPVLAGRISD